MPHELPVHAFKDKHIDVIVINVLSFCPQLHLNLWRFHEVCNQSAFWWIVALDEGFDCCQEIFKAELLAQVYALGNERFELIKELTVPGTVNWRYSTLVIEWEMNIRHFWQDVHDKLETCLLQINFTLRIQALNGLHKVPFKYLIIRLKLDEALISIDWCLKQLVLYVQNRLGVFQELHLVQVFLFLLLLL